jgi:hypothetical protein
VPAAAVIPAPIAYIKVVAVKKLVVEPWLGECGPLNGENCLLRASFWMLGIFLIECTNAPGLLL